MRVLKCIFNTNISVIIIAPTHIGAHQPVKDAGLYHLAWLDAFSSWTMQANSVTRATCCSAARVFPWIDELLFIRLFLGGRWHTSGAIWSVTEWRSTGCRSVMTLKRLAPPRSQPPQTLLSRGGLLLMWMHHLHGANNLPKPCWCIILHAYTAYMMQAMMQWRAALPCITLQNQATRVKTAKLNNREPNISAIQNRLKINDTLSTY